MNKDKRQNYKKTALAILMGGLAAVAVTTAGLAHGLSVARLESSPALSGPSVQGLKISPDGKRITYLQGKEENQAQLDLWEFDTKTGKRRLLVDSNLLLAGAADILSEEEKARRERNRSLTGKSGIVDYYWNEAGDSLLFPLGGDIYLLSLKGAEKAQKPRRLTETDAYETDIRFSPKGRYVSFVREREIYAIDLENGQEKRLTEGATETIANGTAEFAAQEELNRYTGYWWSPNEEHIAFEQYDESGVALKDRYEIQNDGSVITHKQRYPAAGTANVRWRLGVAGLQTGHIHWAELPGGDWLSRDDYLARVHWIKGRDGADQLIVAQLNRAQDALSYGVYNEDGVKIENAGFDFASSVWVNLYDDFKQLKDGRLLLSQDWDQGAEGAFKHLILVDPKDWSLKPLTKGNWVIDDLEGVDEAKGLAYFTGFKDSPLEKHLYSVSLRSGEITRISKQEGWHGVSLGKGFYIDRFSSPTQPPQIALHNLKDGSLKNYILENNPSLETHPYHDYVHTAPTSEYGTLKAADGVTDLYYRLYLPAGYDPKKRYPAILAPYGGPHGQRVQKAWTLDFNHILARQNFIVMVVDNRGMANRGLRFEAALKHKMGRPEIEDQKAAAAFLVEKGYAEADHIGFWGWSYGGYMTLMALTQASDVFAAGVAVAPVSDWRLYDTAYTERYLGQPNEGQVYEDSAVFPYLEGYRDGSLLLIHGMADDNVFFDHSVKMMAALQERQKSFELMTYPGKKHGIRGANTRAHLWGKALEFFERKLK